MGAVGSASETEGGKYTQFPVISQSRHFSSSTPSSLRLISFSATQAQKGVSIGVEERKGGYSDREAGLCERDES
eukprot:668625-Rhodomonas_salina.5